LRASRFDIVGMTRIDIATNEWTGFVIFDDCGPFQAMYRRYGFVRYGNHNGVYWLRTVDKELTADFVAFIDYVNEMRNKANE